MRLNENNKIRRRKVSSKQVQTTKDAQNLEYTQVIDKKVIEKKIIERKEIDDTFELEKELFYKKRAKKRTKRNYIAKRLAVVVLVIAFIASISASALVATALSGAPKVTKDLLYGSFIAQNTVPVAEIPQDLKDALVATEDRRFYEHNGVDYRSLTRSLFNNVFSDSVQGGSTIDMQVSKNLLTSNDKTMTRKIRDIYNAIQMNKIMEKDEILSLYLNNIYFGKGSYGVADAAQTYFGKDVRDLNLAQCAMLAGITNNPNRFMQHSEAKRRQLVVLKHMYQQKYITESEYNSAVNDVTPFKSEIN